MYPNNGAVRIFSAQENAAASKWIILPRYARATIGSKSWQGWCGVETGSIPLYQRSSGSLIETLAVDFNCELPF